MPEHVHLLISEPEGIPTLLEESAKGCAALPSAFASRQAFSSKEGESSERPATRLSQVKEQQIPRLSSLTLQLRSE